MYKLPPKYKINHQYKHQGFSLVEAIAALTVASVMLAVTGPLFMAQRQENVRSEVMSGAKSVAIRCLETLRQQNPANLTISNDFNSANPACNLPAADRTQMGTEYQIATRVRMARLDPGTLVDANGNGNFQCGDAAVASDNLSGDTGSRCITVQVSWQGEVMFTVGSIYASLGVGQGVGQ
jgi:type II secretory pathway pseudopilin PulG